MTTAAQDAAFADLADLVKSIARVVLAENLADDGVVHLVPSEVAVMRHVDRNPGISAGEAARELGLQRSNLSATVRSLVEKGLVERRHGSIDRREVLLVPTDRAARNLARLRASWSSMLADAAPEVDEARLVDAVRVLTAIDEGLRGRRAE